MSAYKDGRKKAQRDAAKEAGYYDGRFAPKVVVDKYHAKDKYLCREKVDISGEPDVLEEVVEDCSKSNDFVQWKEHLTHHPFRGLF